MCDVCEENEHPWRDKQLLTLFYHGFDLSSRDIADIFGCSKSPVLRWMKRHDIERDKSNREKPPYIGEDTDGYKVCYHHDGEKTKRFYLHRLLAVAKFGYDEVKDKQVHHITGHKLDNRIENLELVDQSEHMKRHFTYDMSYQEGLPK